MGLFGALVLGASVIAVVGTAIAFACDELSEREVLRQSQMQEEFRAYERRRHQEYEDARSYYEDARRKSRDNYNRAVAEYQRQFIEKRKKENRPVYEDMLRLHAEQYAEKESLWRECVRITELCEQSIGQQQNTYVRFKSIKTTLISLQEAVYKLEAYLEYLDRYKADFEAVFEDSGEIREPFSLTLPEDYPYEGKVMKLRKGDFQNAGYPFRDAGDIRIDQSDIPVFERCDASEILPFMMYKGRKNGRKYLSLSRGMLKNSIGGTIGIDAEVKEIRPSALRLKFQDNEYLWIWMQKKDMLNQRRKTPIGSSLHVYIKDYDFALKRPVIVSEKVGDGLSMAQFESIMMVQTAAEKEGFHAYLEQNGLLDEEDEWRIAPLWGEKENSLAGVIMQIGNQYAYRALFEELEPGRVILRYRGMLEKEDFVSFDDVFVTTNVTVYCYSPEQIIQNRAAYDQLFEECYKLQLYLTSEFLTQKRMLAASPMSAYLNQWGEITNRLIELLGYGGRQSVSVAERNEFCFGKDNRFTILYLDDSAKVRTFLERERKKNRTRFFIALSSDEDDRLPCRIQDDGEELSLKVNGSVSEQELLERDFTLDLYSIATAYAEKQHANALSAFKEGRVVNEKVKRAVIHVKEESYSDNGYRIGAFFNHDIQTNAAQVDAVVRAFGEEKFFMIQGPPGTGKTTVIKELILQQLHRAPNSKILVVSQANVAVDNVLRGVVEIAQKSSFIEKGQIVRCGQAERIAGDIEEYSFENKYIRYKENLRDHAVEDDKTMKLRKRWLDIIADDANSDVVGECLLGCFQIVGATCVGLESRHYGLSGMEFDLVIIDEAGKALAGELLIPMNRARKVIIIGDHKQLPPIIHPALYKGGKIDYDDVVEEEHQADFLNRSFFQRLYEDCPDTMKCMLKTQFRMPPVIADLVNLFYDGELITGENCYGKKPMFLGNHLIFVDMKNDSAYRERQDAYENGEKSGPYNPEEIAAAKAIVKKIRRYYEKRIVIITPYKKQKNMLIRAFDEKGVWVNTIDAFQGDEEEIVIYCTTRSQKTTLYFSDNARLNVAFSRAKNTLIFLGSSDYLKKYPEDHILYKVSDYLAHKARVVDYEQWLDDDFDLCYDADSRRQEETGPSGKEVITDFAQEAFFEQVKEARWEKKTCESCGKELCEGEDILCGGCLVKSETVRCRCCNREIPYPLYDRYILKRQPTRICGSCQEVVCEECGTTFLIERNTLKGLKKSGRKCLCRACTEKYKEKVHASCEQCGAEMEFTFAYQKRLAENGKELPRICSKCRDKVFDYVTCKECGEEFAVTYGEKEYLERKWLELPKRCKACRNRDRGK